MTPKKPIRYMGTTITQNHKSWRAYIPMPRGQGRVSKTCRTLPELKAWINTHAPDIMRGHQPLTTAQADEYRTAIASLPPGMSLLQAVHAAARATRAPLAGKTLGEAAEAYLHLAQISGRRPATIRSLRETIRLLEPHHAAPVARVGHDDILALLPTRLAPQTREGRRVRLTAFFRWCITAGYSTENPLAAITPIRTDARAPRIYTTAQVAALMAKAETVDDLGTIRGNRVIRDHRILIPYLSIAFFAGVRPGALREMTADDIDLANSRILISPHGDKTRRAWYAPINTTLNAWLNAYPPHKRITPLSPGCLDIHIRQLHAAARVKRIQDAPRHCFASYTYALTGDAPRTAAAMGHFGKTDTLFTFYRSLATPESASAFFAIRPKSALNTTQKAISR